MKYKVQYKAYSHKRGKFHIGAAKCIISESLFKNWARKGKNGELPQVTHP